MVISEIIIAAIADSVFGFTADHWGEAFTDKARDLLGKNPTKKAFKEALAATFARFQAQDQYKEWIDSSFDASFFAHEGAPILAQFLLRGGRPDPSDLAMRWADSLNLRQPERRASYTRELEPIAAAFLAIFSEQLKNKVELRDLFNDRAFEQLAQDLHHIRQSLGAEKATPGTRRDYLRWLLERNLYLDPRGTLQTQRQVQVKLDEVYVSLKAQREVSPGLTDRLQVEQELTGLETKSAPHSLAAEEIEDQYEQLQTGLEKRAFAALDGPGEVLDLAECVRRHDRLVILGDPGSGKTTLLRYLALTHAKALWNERGETSSGPAHFPILLKIAEYAEDGRWKKTSLSDFLVQYHILHECPLHGLADLFHTELEQGHCLILLDGLDEIVSADERRDVVQRMEDFVQRHSGKANRFVITSRVAGYRSAPLGGPFTHYTIQDMEETHIRRFLERWCQAVEDAQTPEVSLQERQKVAQREIDGIMQAVDLTPGVRRLAANPLLLCTLALIHRTGAQLPQKRIELYKLAADVLARTWRLAQSVPESALVKDEYLTPMLSKLAYWLHLHKPTGVATEREVYTVLGEEWARLNDMVWDKDEPAPKIKEEIHTFLLAVREHTGLFVERAPRRYGFMHLTFEEYYAARYLVARSKWRAKLIRQHLHDPRWQEPILLALGFVGLESPEEASELLETAVLAQGDDAKELGFTPSKYEDLLGRDYLFVLRCLSDMIPVRASLMKQLIERLADELVHHTGPARFSRYQQALREIIGHLGGSKGALLLLPLLLSALHDSDKTIRQGAAQSIGFLRMVPSAVAMKLLAAMHDSDAGVRYHAVWSLAYATPTQVVMEMIMNALHDPDSGVRRNAAWSLGVVGIATSEVIKALLTALYDRDGDVHFKTITSLIQLGQACAPEVRDTLLQALHDPDSKVRVNAIESLRRLAQASPDMRITFDAALLSALHDPDAYVRGHAALSLELPTPPIPELQSALSVALRDPDVYVRIAAAVSLGRLAGVSPEVLATLKAALHDPGTDISARAAIGLGQLSEVSPEALVTLKAALHDPVADIRANAAVSLGQLKHVSPEVLAGLLVALRQAKSWWLRRDSAQILGQLSPENSATLSALWRGLRDEDDRVRMASAQAIVRWAKRFPTSEPALETRLLEAIQNPEFAKPDKLQKRSVWDYAYEAFWSLVVGQEEK